MAALRLRYTCVPGRFVLARGRLHNPVVAVSDASRDFAVERLESRFLPEACMSRLTVP